MWESISFALGAMVGWVAKSIAENTFVASLRKFRDLRFEVRERLRYYANVYCNPGFSNEEKLKEAARDLRSLATRLLTAYEAVPLVKAFAILRLVPPNESVQSAYGRLLFLVNSLAVGKSIENIDAAEEVAVRLGLATNKPLTEQWKKALDDAEKSLG